MISISKLFKPGVTTAAALGLMLGAGGAAAEGVRNVTNMKHMRNDIIVPVTNTDRDPAPKRAIDHCVWWNGQKYCRIIYW